MGNYLYYYQIRVLILLYAQIVKGILVIRLMSDFIVSFVKRLYFGYVMIVNWSVIGYVISVFKRIKIMGLMLFVVVNVFRIQGRMFVINVKIGSVPIM